MSSTALEQRQKFGLPGGSPRPGCQSGLVEPGSTVPVCLALSSEAGICRGPEAAVSEAPHQADVRGNQQVKREERSPLGKDC